MLRDDPARRRNEQREGFGVTVGRNHHDRDVRAARSVRWQRQFDFQALVSDALGVEAVNFWGRSTVFDFGGQGRSQACQSDGRGIGHVQAAQGQLLPGARFHSERQHHGDGRRGRFFGFRFRALSQALNRQKSRGTEAHKSLPGAPET